MEFIDPKLDEYVMAHCQKEQGVLEELNRETHHKMMQPRMLSGQLQGQLLRMISMLMRPKCILEIGTYTGYSAISLAGGLDKNGILHTIEFDEEREDFAKAYIEKAGLNEQIKIHLGNALDIIPQIDTQFDLVFIDADKINYSNYFDLVIDKVAKNGLIIADNVLWSGKVIQTLHPKDKDTKAILDFNKKIHEDSRVENILLPIRDGLMACRKI
jgi:predicted O-methyltransferase YrrM